MSAGLGVDELRRDAEIVAGAPDAALEHIAHAELAPELGDVHRLPLVLEGRVAREHAQVARPRQLGQDVLGQAVAEILLARVAAQVDEGEDRDPWTFGHAGRGGLDRSLGCRHPMVAVEPRAGRAEQPGSAPRPARPSAIAGGASTEGAPAAAWARRARGRRAPASRCS